MRLLVLSLIHMRRELRLNGYTFPSATAMRCVRPRSSGASMTATLAHGNASLKLGKRSVCDALVAARIHRVER
jgi:hypothetical protein